MIFFAMTCRVRDLDQAQKKAHLHTHVFNVWSAA
jgi:hypothetical protein